MKVESQVIAVLSKVIIPVLQISVSVTSIGNGSVNVGVVVQIGASI